MTFVIGSFRAVERPGGGHRASAAGLWRGEDLRSGDEVALTVLPVECADEVRVGVQEVRAIRHPHLLPVVDVVADDERVALVCPWPRAGRLLELLVRRGRLTVGETLTVLIPLASALAVAHARGVRHGGVCPEAVWFYATGRPFLGALAASRIIAELNDGLPADSRDVAPEVVRGERVRGGPVTAAADVFSLGSVALHCLTGRSAWPADDPADVLIQSAAGLWPEPPQGAGPPDLLDLVRAMLSGDAERRPSAASVARRLALVTDPEPIQFGAGPAPAPASADRWRGWSERRPTPPDPPVVDRTEHRPRSDSPAAGSPIGRWTRTPRRPETSDGDPTERPGPLARVGVAVLCGLLGILVAVQVGAWWSGWDDPGAPSATQSDPADPGWPAVVAGLDAARGRALAAADVGLLDEVYVEGSPSATADAAIIERLADQGWRVVDGVHRISSVRVEDPDAAGNAQDGDAVRVAVVDTLPSHVIVDAAGHQVGLTPALDEQRRVLVLNNTDGGYRISGVEPG